MTDSLPGPLDKENLGFLEQAQWVTVDRSHVTKRKVTHQLNCEGLLDRPTAHVGVVGPSLGLSCPPIWRAFLLVSN